MSVREISYFYHDACVLGNDLKLSVVPMVIYCAPSEVETLKRIACSYLLVSDELDDEDIPEYLSRSMNIAPIIHRVGHRGRSCALCTLEEALQRNVDTPVTVNTRTKSAPDIVFSDLARGYNGNHKYINVLVSSLVSGVCLLNGFAASIDVDVPVEGVLLVTRASSAYDLVPRFQSIDSDTRILVSEYLQPDWPAPYTGPDYLSPARLAAAVKHLFPEIGRIAVADKLFMYGDD
jgi:hypothetical protein